MPKMTMQLALRRTALSAALALCVATTAHAQSNTTGQIVGEADAGSQITATNPNTGFSRTVTADANGNYRVASLPTGTYTVTLTETDGSTSVRENVAVAVGTGTSVDFAGAAAPSGAVQLDRITVTGSYVSPIDMSSVESATIVTEETIDRLPVPRNVTAVALLAPGTTQGDSDFGNLASFGGATVGENAYYINGFNVTNFRNGLGFSDVPFEMYSQYQVKTGGYGAEFGRSTGGVVNAITKRGSNEWHWGGNMYWTGDWGRKAYPDVYDADGELVINYQDDQRDEMESNMYLSGPLIRDRVFFYGIASARVDEFYNADATGGVVESRDDSPFYGLKVDAYLTDNHRLEYTGFKDEAETVSPGTRSQTPLPGQPQGYVGPTATASLVGGDNDIVKYTGYFGDDLTLSALWGEGEYSLSGYNSGPSAGECQFVTYNPLVGDTRNLGCAVRSLNAIGEDKRTAYRVDVEWDLGEFLWGTHYLRFGIDRETNETVDGNVIQGADGYRYVLTEDNNDTASDTSDDFWFVQRDIYNNVGSFETISNAFYLEDQWQVTEDLLLTLGIRNEEFNNKNAAGESFIHIENQWAPRVGMSWDIGGEGTRKLFANYGRYHLPVANNTNVRLAGTELYLRDLFFWDGESFGPNMVPILGDQFDAIVLADGGVTPTISSVDQDIEPMYQDEIILGYQWEFMPKWSVGIRGIYRDLKSTLEDMAVDAGLNRYMVDNGIAPSVDCTGPDGNPDGIPDSVGCGFDYYVLGNPGFPITIGVDIDGDGDLDNVELTAEQLGYDESVRKYKAVELFFERAWDDVWFMQGSYTYANSYGNNEGFVRSDNDQDDAGLTTLFDQPGLGDGTYGDLPNDRPHTLKLWGAWKFAPEFMVSGNLLVQSGRPINCFGNHPTDDFAAAYGSSSLYCNNELVPRGSRGRTDTITQLDLGLEYRPLWAGETLAFSIDVYNVLGAQNETQVWEVGEFDFTNTPHPLYGIGTDFQRQRAVRISASFDW